MRIDRAKSPQLLSAIMSIALATSVVGCVDGSSNEQITPTSRCGVPAEAIRPPSLDREFVATYQGGIVVNMAGTIADIAVNVPNLTRINNDSTLGLSVPGYTYIIYFFSGSFSRPDAQTQMDTFFQAQKFYLSARYCQEQGTALDKILRTSLSVGDAADEVTTANPAPLRGSRFWILALERELGKRYILGTRSLIDRDLSRPAIQLSDTVIDRVLTAGLPFRIIRLTESKTSI